METFKASVKAKALSYLNETDDSGTVYTTFPQTIVDYVVEYAYKTCHFPSSYNEKKRISVLKECETAIAMACVDVYFKVGYEGQTQYSSNGIQRVMKSEWISSRLLEQLPNYVGVL